MDVYGKIIDWIRQTTVPIAAVLITSGVFLFLPAGSADRIGIRELQEGHATWAGLAFIVSAGLLAAQSLVWLGGKIRTEVTYRMGMRRKIGSLRYLSAEEKKLLARYIESDSQTQYHEISDGVVQGLFRKGYLYKPSSVSRYRLTWAYNIQPWLWDHLKKHPELLASQ